MVVALRLVELGGCFVDLFGLALDCRLQELVAVLQRGDVVLPLLLDALAVAGA